MKDYVMFLDQGSNVDVFPSQFSNQIYFSQNAHISFEYTCVLVAREICMSPFHFHRTFSNTFGMSPFHFHNSIKMQKAKQLLNSRAGRSKRWLTMHNLPEINRLAGMAVITLIKGLAQVFICTVCMPVGLYKAKNWFY